MRHFFNALITILLIESSILANEPEAPGLKLQEGLIRCFLGNQTDTLNLSECMSFGLITIGDNRKEVVELMGNPDRLIDGIDTAQIGIYPLTAGKAGVAAYLLVTISNQIVTTLLLQGPGPSKEFSFSGITPGDSTNKVIELLGSPSSITPNEDYDSELWKYGSYPFSFEMENNLVFSIQIWMVTETK